MLLQIRCGEQRVVHQPMLEALDLGHVAQKIRVANLHVLHRVEQRHALLEALQHLCQREECGRAVMAVSKMRGQKAVAPQEGVKK